MFLISSLEPVDLDQIDFNQSWQKYPLVKGIIVFANEVQCLSSKETIGN
jgi:hypothetical protein